MPIIVDELTMSILVTGYIWILVPIAVILWKTPALQYIKAVLGGKMMLPVFGEDKILRFVPVKKTIGGLAETKYGYYNIEPNDIYFESKSKVPMALAFSNFAYSINPKMMQIIKKLKESGLRNFNEIESFYKRLQKQGKDLELEIGDKDKKETEFLSSVVEMFKGGIKEFKEAVNPILGHSLNLSDIVYYFKANDRSDLIESEIQRRNIATIKRSGADNMKWLILVGIFIILLAVALYIFSLITPQPVADPNAIGNAVADAINRKVVTGTQIG